MSTEEKIIDLMKPRYKVIADYPKSPYEIGEILYWHNTGKAWDNINEGFYSLYQEWRPVSTIKVFLPGLIESFPHLFRKLEWWEERTKEEMPEYIYKKVNFGNGKVFYKTSEVLLLDDAYMKWKFGGGYSRIDFFPATLSDYNNYLTPVPAIDSDNK